MKQAGKPYLINFTGIGEPENGYISVAQAPLIPFAIKRVYWTYYTPDGVVRGHHTHKKLRQVICAVHGCIIFNLEDKAGDKFRFVLDHPSKGLFIPPMHWRTIELSKDAVLLCLASEEYNEDDYIREYDVFKNV
ncbi:MAG: sugar 3,4-ketoisomerase [Bacteroidia bacterium]